MTKNFELNLSHEELVKRTSKDCLIPKEMLKEDSKEYAALADGDKEALKHLVKAAKAIDKVFMQQDNPDNLEFKTYLEEEAQKGNEDAQMTLTLRQICQKMSFIKFSLICSTAEMLKK